MAGEAYVGGEAKFYYNTGTTGSPTWGLIDNCGDLSLADSRTAVATPIRRDWPFIGYLVGSRDLTLTWTSIQRQETTDTVLTALLAAYVAGIVTEFAIADGAIATAGTKYKRVICVITKADEGQPIDGGVEINFEAKFSVNNGGTLPTLNTAV